MRNERFRPLKGGSRAPPSSTQTPPRLECLSGAAPRGAQSYSECPPSRAPQQASERRQPLQDGLGFRNFALGDAIGGRSGEGKFIRRIEAELLDQLGDNPTFAQLLLVRRAARAALKLEAVRPQLAEGDVNGYDSRMLRRAEQQLAPSVCARSTRRRSAFVADDAQAISASSLASQTTASWSRDNGRKWERLVSRGQFSAFSGQPRRSALRAPTSHPQKLAELYNVKALMRRG
jgi:hypothetical protein